MTVYKYEDDPALYKQARKRLQNKLSAQFSRFERVKQAQSFKETEEQMLQQIKSLQRELDEKQIRLNELQSKQEQHLQSAPLLELDNPPLPSKRATSGHSTLDDEIQVPVRQTQRLKANKPSEMSDAVIDGTIAATISTTALELLTWVVLRANSDLEELSFLPNQGYRIAKLKPPVEARSPALL